MDDFDKKMAPSRIKPRVAYKKMRFPLTLISKNDICAEIGVLGGEFSSLILDKGPKELHLIDPWIMQEEYKDRCYGKDAGQESLSKFYNHVVNKFKNRSEVTIHKNFSTDVKFSPKYFDWVYIDGNHSYAFVLKDLEFYYPFMKDGGYLCGDDIGWGDGNDGGPRRAVNEFTKTHNLPFKIRGTQFVIEIKNKKT